MTKLKGFLGVAIILILWLCATVGTGSRQHHYIQVLNNEVWELDHLEQVQPGLLFRSLKEQNIPSVYVLETDTIRIEAAQDLETYPTLRFRVLGDFGLDLTLEGLTQCMELWPAESSPRSYARLSLSAWSECETISPDFFETSHRVFVLLQDKDGQEILRAPIDFIAIANGWFWPGPVMP